MVAHRLAANIHDCKASDDDLWDEPKPGRGRTLNDAARMVARHLHDWCGDGPRRVFIGRGLGEQSQLAEVWRSGTGLSMKPVAKEPIREVVKDPFGGFRREVLEGYEAYSGGFHADMLVGGGR